MTSADVVPILTGAAAFVAAVGSAIAAVISARNSRTLTEVKHHTDGLVERLGDTKLAQGIAEGTAQGLKQGRQEAVK